jgi:hypothetical protein
MPDPAEQASHTENAAARWGGAVRDSVCLALIFGPPVLGASAVSLWWIAAAHWTSLRVIGGNDGLQPARWAALAAAGVTTLGVALLPIRASVRIVAAFVSFVVATVVYGCLYVMLICIVAWTITGP